jgi:hypothetical protein
MLMIEPTTPTSTAEPPARLGSPASDKYLHATAQTLINTVRNSRLFDGDLVPVIEQILRRTIRLAAQRATIITDPSSRLDSDDQLLIAECRNRILALLAPRRYRLEVAMRRTNRQRKLLRRSP